MAKFWPLHVHHYNQCMAIGRELNKQLVPSCICTLWEKGRAEPDQTKVVVGNHLRIQRVIQESEY